MADISKLKTPDGTTYSLKDETARAGLEGKAAASHTHSDYMKKLQQVGNWNDVSDVGWFIGNNAANAPTQYAQYVGYISIYVQELYPVATFDPSIPISPYKYVRYKTNDGWSSWEQVCFMTTTEKSNIRSLMQSITNKADASHTHTKSQITDFPTSLPANGGNADTVDGKHASDFLQKSDVMQFMSHEMKYMAFDDRIKYYSDSDELSRGIYFINNSPNTIRVTALISAKSAGPLLQYGYGSNTYPDIQDTGVGREWYVETAISTTPYMYQMEVPSGKLGYFGVYRTNGNMAVIHQINCLDFNNF